MAVFSESAASLSCTINARKMFSEVKSPFRNKN